MVALLFGKNTRTHTCVFDVNSASVGVAVVSFDNSGDTTIHATHRVAITYGEKSDAQSLGTYLSHAVQQAGTQALESIDRLEAFAGPSEIHVLTHAPWADTQSQSAEETFESETVMTKELLRDFVAQHLPSAHVDGRIEFDRHVSRIDLNGYSTTNPYDKQATQIGVTVITSSMAEVIYQYLLDALASVFPNASVHVDSFAFALTQLSEAFDDNDAYTLIDVGGEYTSVYVVRDATIAGSVWAPFGTEYLIRAVGGEDPDAQASARSEVTMYLENTCTPAQCRKVEEALKVAEGQWTQSFGDACATLAKHTRLPDTTFLSVDQKYSTWFERGVEKLDFSQFTVTGQPLQAHMFTTDQVAHTTTFAPNAKRDSLLALGALFISPQPTP